MLEEIIAHEEFLWLAINSSFQNVRHCLNETEELFSANWNQKFKSYWKLPTVHSITAPWKRFEKWLSRERFLFQFIDEREISWNHYELGF